MITPRIDTAGVYVRNHNESSVVPCVQGASSDSPAPDVSPPGIVGRVPTGQRGTIPGEVEGLPDRRGGNMGTIYQEGEQSYHVTTYCLPYLPGCIQHFHSST